MNDRILGAFLGSLLVLGATAGVTAQEGSSYVRGEPDLDVYAPDSTLVPGRTTELTLQVSNGGEVAAGDVSQRDMVTTARNVRVEVEADDGPITVETTKIAIGAIADGTVQEVPITVTVPEDVEPGDYDLDVRLQYSHTAVVYSNGSGARERNRAVTRTIPVAVDDAPRFRLRTVGGAIQVGDSGTITTDLENVGGQPARDLTVELESTSDNVLVGGGSSAAAGVDELDPGENTTITYDVALPAEAAVRNYSLDGTVRFTDPDGIRGLQDGLTARASTLDNQDVSIAIDESTLRVGEVGTLIGTVHNNGPVGIENAALSLGDGPLEPRSGTHAIGDLGVNETADFQFSAAVPESADPVSQLIDVTTTYRTGGEEAQAVSQPVIVPVAEQQFAVSIEESALRVGDVGTITGTVRNDGPAAVEGVTLGLDAGPLEARSRTYAVGDLAVGEDGTFRFSAAVPDGVDPVPQRIEVTTTYRAGAGRERAVSDALRVEVADRRDAVAVSAVDPRYDPGEESVLELEVTNQREIELRDVRLTLSVEQPLESDFRTAVIPSLQPGGTDTASFDLQVDDGAPASRFPATVAIEYVDGDGRTNTARSATVAISVTATEGGGVPIELLIFGALVVLVGAGAWWFYGRE